MKRLPSATHLKNEGAALGWWSGAHRWLADKAKRTRGLFGYGSQADGEASKQTEPLATLRANIPLELQGESVTERESGELPACLATEADVPLLSLTRSEVANRSGPSADKLELIYENLLSSRTASVGESELELTGDKSRLHDVATPGTPKTRPRWSAEKRELINRQLASARAWTAQDLHQNAEQSQCSEMASSDLSGGPKVKSTRSSSVTNGSETTSNDQTLPVPGKSRPRWSAEKRDLINKQLASTRATSAAVVSKNVEGSKLEGGTSRLKSTFNPAHATVDLPSAGKPPLRLRSTFTPTKDFEGRYLEGRPVPHLVSTFTPTEGIKSSPPAIKATFQLRFTFTPAKRLERLHPHDNEDSELAWRALQSTSTPPEEATPNAVAELKQGDATRFLPRFALPARPDGVAQGKPVLPSDNHTPLEIPHFLRPENECARADEASFEVHASEGGGLQGPGVLQDLRKEVTTGPARLLNQGTATPVVNLPNPELTETPVLVVLEHPSKSRAQRLQTTLPGDAIQEVDSSTTPSNAQTEVSTPRVRPQRQGLILDFARISALQKETETGSKYLAAIFSEQDGSPPPSSKVLEKKKLPDKASTPGFMGLDETHTALARMLLTRTRWSRAELLKVALDLELMLDGALERINEASFDAHDSAFTEGDDPVEVTAEILEKVST